MSKKRILTILLVISMVLTLFAGCGQSAPAASNEPTPTTAPTSAPTATAAPDATATPEGNAEVAKPDGYPSEAIHWIVPAAAGAALDLPTRALGDKLKLGQSIVVENIAGGSQTIGTAEAVNRDANGYTLVTMANACGISQPLMTQLSYKISDLRMIAMIAPPVQSVVAVRADSKIKTVDDWLAMLKSGENYAFGITNAGGFGHMSIASALSQLGHYGDPNGVMVVYNGSAENITALLSGEAGFIVADAPDVMSRVQSGEVRVITVLHDQVCPLYPDAPTISKYNVNDMSTFVGLKWVAVRSDTPDNIVAWLKQELNKTIQSDEYQQYLVKQGFGKMGVYSEDEINQILATASADYGKVMKAVGLIK